MPPEVEELERLSSMDRFIQAILVDLTHAGWALAEEPARDDGPYNTRTIGWNGVLSRGSRIFTASAGWRTHMRRRLVAEVLKEFS